MSAKGPDQRPRKQRNLPFVVVTGLAQIFCRPVILQRAIRPERLQYAGEGGLRAESLCLVPEVVGGHFCERVRSPRRRRARPAVEHAWLLTPPIL